MAPVRIRIAFLGFLLATSSAMAVDLDLRKSVATDESFRDAVVQLLLSSAAAPEVEPAPFPLPEGGTCSLTSMSCNTTRSGSLGLGDCWLDSDFTYLDFWSFTGTAGQKVTITMRSGTIDSYLGLIDPGATTVVARDNNSAGGLDARITYTLTKSGTWTIVANEMSIRSGSYSMQLECESASSCDPQVRSTSCGQNVTGIIDSLDCNIEGFLVEYWSFTGTSGQPFTASASRSGGNGNLGLVVFHQDGTALGNEAPDNGTATVAGTLPKSGTWYVAVAATASANYSLSTSCQAQTSGCQPSSDNLCLSAKRFRVIVSARDPRSGKTGSGVAIPYNDINGFFALPALTGDASNFEVFVKLLDGRPVNGKFWVFYGGLTDFEYTISVTDSVTQQTKTYTKAGGQYGGGADVSAF